MRNKVLYILLMITTALSWSLEVGAQTTYYVCDDANERSWGTINNSGEYNLNGPGLVISYEAKRSTLGANYFFVQYYNGKSWVDMANPDLSTNYKSYSCTVPSLDIRKIRFATKTGATLNKNVRNVKVTRATTIETTFSSLSFGEVKFGSNASKTITVNYNNTYSGARLTGTCDNSAFTVTQEDMGETGSKGITVTYTPTALGEQKGTVTLTMGTAGMNNDVTTTFEVSGTGITDYHFSATAGANNDLFGSVSAKFENASTETSVLNTTASSAEKTATFTATPNAGYEFDGWATAVDATSYESTENPYSTTITNSTAGSNVNKTLYAIFRPIPTPEGLILSPDVAPSYTAGEYTKVTLNRSFKAGYNTLALPFNTTVEELTGRTNNEDWVAQLSIVTWNAKDGYTLFFQKVDGGAIAANEPYILHLANAVENPQWTETIAVEVAEAKSKAATHGYGEYTQWAMHANYALNFDMKDKYGIVNTESNQGGLLMLGAEGSTLAPYSAYITTPATTANKVRSAFINQTTDIEALSWTDADDINAVYDACGKHMGKQMRSGLNIVHMKNGEVKKLWVR